MKLPGLSFPSLKMRITYLNHRIVQKITSENTHEMKTHLEDERYLETSDSQGKAAGRSVYMSQWKSLVLAVESCPQSEGCWEQCYRRLQAGESRGHPHKAN